jgi:hypothetical protein
MDFLATQFQLGMTVYVYGVSTVRADVVPAAPDEPKVVAGLPAPIPS